MMRERPIDLRNLPVWERATTVLEHSDALAAGAGFEFLTELNPRALLSRLEQLRPGQLSFEQRHAGENQWHVVLTRVAVEEGASSLDAALRRNSIFTGLKPDSRAALRQAMQEQTARKGETICAENSACSSLGVLLEGALAVFVGAGSRERLLFHLFPFDLFGEIEFFDNGLAIGRTTVLSKSARFATVPYGMVREVALGEPDFIIKLGACASQHNRTLASALAQQVSQPILSRVAGALLPYAAPERGLHPAMPPLPTMTQTQLAAAAGTVKEVAARAIAELERVQGLRREHGHIRYLDRSKLLETIDRG